MKPFSLFAITTILALLLGSCSPPQTNTQNVTVTSQVTVTSIPSPTIAPAPAETSTPTKDPNAPDGFTRFENGVYYQDIKTEKGNTLTYIWDKERGVWTTIVLTGSFEPNTQANHSMGGHDLLPMTVQIDQTVVRADTLPSFSMRPFNGEVVSWANLFGTLFDKQLITAGFVTDSNFDLRPWWDGSHKFHYKFLTQSGQQLWGLYDDYQKGGTATIVNINIRGDYADLKAGMKQNGFSEVSSENASYGPVTDFMIKLSTKDGSLYVDIAPDPSHSVANMPQKLFVWMFAYGPSVVMDTCTDASKTCDLTTLPSWSQMLDQLVLNQKTFTWFDLAPSQ